ncbi:MAG TPA: sulfatase, partial [Verrucomicrobiales bacterium]|nr:sulfatase [Verrucomicrobiales bacterium]
MRHLLPLTLLTFLPLLSSARAPNILWFVVDDMSPHFSCYGETAIQTPAVDRLAAEGARFTRAFAATPLCSPSRASILTGQYVRTNGILDNTARDSTS